jgi:hypothetical protein
LAKGSRTALKPSKEICRVVDIGGDSTLAADDEEEQWYALVLATIVVES